MYLSLFRSAWRLALFFFLGLRALPLCQGQGESPLVVMRIELHTEIDDRSLRYLEHALLRSKEVAATHILLEMNTYGGALDAADKMRQLLLSEERPLYVFINKNAASAGALLSLACDSIYMAPGASIGAATVVMGMGGEAAPDKYQSYMRGLMRSTAEVHGRDPLLAEAMVDPDIVIDDLAPKGKILTLSTQQALTHGYCEGVFDNTEQLLAHVGLRDATLLAYASPWEEKVIAFFMHPFVSSLLILIILGGIYTEIRTPGVGLPGGAALVAMILYLVPYYLSGLAAHWEIALLFCSIALVVIEVFVVPGFGVLGLAGGLLMIASLLLIMLGNDFFDFSAVSSSAMTEAALVVLCSLVGGTTLAVLVSYRLKYTRFYSRVALTTEMKPEAGYRTQIGKESLLGATGAVYSVLRPSGKVLVAGKVYEAISVNGDYLPKDTLIEVVSEEGREWGVIATDKDKET